MSDADDADADATPLPLSKSARKREWQAVVALAESIVALGRADLRQLPLEAETLAALEATQAMKKGARKRQLKTAAALLAGDDLVAVRAALEERNKPHRQAVRRFHEVEQWRDALITGDAGLLEVLRSEYPHGDHDALEAAVRAAIDERERGGSRAAARALFRQLAELVQLQPPS